MHNPTRRAKRFKRPLYPTRPPPGFDPLAETSDYIRGGSYGERETADGSLNSNHDHGHLRLHRRTAQPDALRGVVLVALVIVIVVLYFTLRELERSTYGLVPRPNLTWQRSAATASTSGPWGATGIFSTMRYPQAIVKSSGEGLPVASDDDNTSIMPALPVSPGKPTSHVARPPPVTLVLEEYDGDTDANILRALDDPTEENENDDDTRLLLASESFDSILCNGACRFLLPARIGEQESKARIHLMQLATLARRLDRTIVLPNVGKSRMSACSEWPFGAYYDGEAFERGLGLLLGPGTEKGTRGSLPAIDLEGFMKWVDERPAPPNGFVVSMESVRQSNSRGELTARTESKDAPLVVEKAEVDPEILSCLGSELSRLRSTLPERGLSVSFRPGSFKTDVDASTHLVQLLSNTLEVDSDSDPDFDSMTSPGTGYDYAPGYTNASFRPSLADVDVLVVDYDLRHPIFFARPDVNLHYAPALYDLADRLAENLGPFVGVHWRMENVPVQNLAWCAAALVSSLRALLEDEVGDGTVRYVWLATDYPRPLDSFVDDRRTFIEMGEGRRPTRKNDRAVDGIHGPSKKSSTFKALSIEHDDAIGILVEAFQAGGELDAWRLTDLAEQLHRYPYVEGGGFAVNETLLSDSGVFGILDKLVVVQARAFVSGSTECGKISSFSKQVIEARQESFEAERGRGVVRNVVEYFGKS